MKAVSIFVVLLSGGLPLFAQEQESAPDRPQTPIGPFPYEVEQVQFENKLDKLTLAGTLTLPRKSGRHPAVVLISGSGPQDRDETLFGHKPFLVIADYLTRRGLAVLRYDDRGTGESTGDFSTATTMDLANDAATAIDFLKQHSAINSDQIGFVGHSEGGAIGPLLASQRDDVAFVVMLAGPGVDGAEVLTSQNRALLEAMKMAPDFVDRAVKIHSAAVGVAKESKLEEDISEKIKNAIEDVVDGLPEKMRPKPIEPTIDAFSSQLKSKWIRFFIQYDPRPSLEKLDCPVLAITGSKDTQVLPAVNHPEIEAALNRGGNKDFKVLELENLNHLFQQCETGTVYEYNTIKETFNPAALKVIGDWISERTELGK